MEQNQELANNRMAELEKLQQELQEAVRESEKLKVQKSSPLREFKTKLTAILCLLNKGYAHYLDSLDESGVKSRKTIILCM